MLRGLARAFAQLGDPTIRRILWRSVGLTVVGLIVLVAAVGFGLDQIALSGWGWLNSALTVLGTAGTVVLGIVLFPALVGLISCFFLEEVAEAVERRHYPGLPPPRRQGIGEAVGTALTYLVALIVLNLVALIVGLIVPVISWPVFYLLNGYLLGREYYELVALRRLAPAEARAQRQRHRGRLLVVGVVIAVLLSVPVVNLLVPIVATAFAVHVFQEFVYHA